jgi:hypothetical protein
MKVTDIELYIIIIAIGSTSAIQKDIRQFSGFHARHALGV